MDEQRVESLSFLSGNRNCQEKPADDEAKEDDPDC